MHVRAIISMARSNLEKNTSQEELHNNLKIVAIHIDDGLRIHKSVSRHSNPIAWIFR